MDIEVLFPTLVGVSQAEPSQILEIEREVLREEPLMKSLLSYSWGDNVLSSFQLERNLFERARLQHLQAFVEQEVMKFVQQTRQNTHLVIDPTYTQSWVNVTRKYGFQERHNHERAVPGLPISGAYYFRTNGRDGNLAIFPTDMQYKLFEAHDIAPACGKLVLFRSEVFHRVGVNLTDDDRISFSFNLLLHPA